jgi:PAS domain S-box-containing protein
MDMKNEDLANPFSHILVIEDDKGLNLLIQKILKKEGYDVLHAYNARAALEQLQDHPHCLLLLDYNLPDMHAKEFIGMLKENNYSCPFIISTGYGNEKLAVEMMKLGAYDYIVKDSSFLDILIPVIKKTEKQLDTEIKLEQIKLKLELNERHYRVLAENMADMVCVHDLKGFYTFVSSSVSILLGYTSEELLDTNPLNIVHPDDKEDYLNNIKPVILSSVYWRHECRYIKKDGDSVWVEVKGKPVRDENNVVIAYQTITRDITERKHAEQTLKESEEKFRHLVETTSDIIWETNTEGVFTYINPRVEYILGYKPEEVIGHSPFHYMPVDEANNIKKISDKIVELKKPFENLININLHIDGYQVIFETSGVPVFDANNNLTGYRGIDRDITERMRMEDELRQSEILANELLNGLPESVFLIDKDGVVLAANKTTLERLNCSKQEFIGSCSFDFIPESLVEERHKFIDGVVQSAKPVRFEDIRNNKNIDNSITPVINEKGEVTQLVVVEIDITERKLAEEKIRESEALFFTIFNTIPIPVSLSDLATEKWIEVNDAFLKTTGYSRSDTIGHSFRNINLWKNIADRDKMQSMLLEKGKVADFEVEINKNNGTTGIMLISVEEVELTGKPYLLIMGKEITEQKTLMTVLKESEEKFSKAFKTSPYGISITEALTGKIIEINDGFLKLSGYTYAEVIGKSTLDLRFWEKENDRIAVVNDLKNKNEIRNREYNFQKKSGKILSGLFSAEIILLNNTTYILSSINDITERKQAEKALKESESSLSYAQEIANMGSWEWDMITQKTTWSENYFTFFGINPLMTEPNFELFRNKIHPDDVHSFDEMHANLIKNKMSVSFELRIILTDGTIRWIQNNVAPIIEDNEIIKLKGAFIDITELKQAEIELLESKNYLDKIINSIASPIFVKDIEHKFCLVNDALCSLLNIPKEKLIGTSDFDYFPEEQARVFIAKDEEVFRTGIENINEEYITDGIGIIRSIVTRKTIYIDSIGNKFLVGIINDITELKKTQKELLLLLNTLEIRVNERTEELSRSEELYFNTVNAFDSWVFVIDDEWKILFLNSSLKEFFYRNGEPLDIIGKNIRNVFRFLNEENFAFYNKVFNECIETENEGEFVVYGRKYYTLTRLSPIVRNKKVVRIVTTVRDQTKLKLIEEDIKKNLEREKELNALKSQFISTVSHEFRTPLAGILSSAQLLKMYNNKWDTDKKDKVFKQIFDSVNHNMRLLDDVSLVNKGENNTITMKPSMINLQKLLQNIIEENEQVYGHDFEIVTTYHLRKSEYFFDTEIIRHIFGNVLSNAIKYSGESKKIIFNVTEEKDKILFNIIDSGIGIPAEDQKFLFETFHRASNVGTIRGTGFGLSIVKRMVDMLNGEIEIVSEEGKGTNIIIKLPVLKNTENDK